MGKKFNILTTISSNEVSLCSKYNSGANKQTEFELVKDKEESKKLDIKPVLKSLLEMEETPEWTNGFKDFLEYWLEYDVNNCFYGLLNEGLQNSLCAIQYNDELTKEEKTQEYIKLFGEFIDMYNSLPITKTQDGKYEVSLISKSHIKEQDIIPQNETEDITKEKTSKMEKQSMFEQAVELLKSALGLEKTETPAEQPVVEEAPVEEVVKSEETVEETPVEETAETVAEEKTEVEETPVKEATEPAEVEEAPVEEPAVEEVTEKAEEVETEEAPVEKTAEPSELEVALEKAKTLENEIAELKKAKEEKEIEIEKMSFIQKAKDEYSMLVGTPEEIGAQLYSISKSNLDETSKSFILENLKKVSSNNQELTEEVGSITKSAENMTDEEVLYAKAEEIAKAKNISVNKALREIK